MQGGGEGRERGGEGRGREEEQARKGGRETYFCREI